RRFPRVTSSDSLTMFTLHCLLFYFLFSYSYAAPRHLHSFPTRRSSDLTIRERIERLCDKDSFHEIGALAGFASYEDDELTNPARDRKSTRLNSSHGSISYAVFCLKKKKKETCKGRTISNSSQQAHSRV